MIVPRNDSALLPDHIGKVYHNRDITGQGADVTELPRHNGVGMYTQGIAHVAVHVGHSSEYGRPQVIDEMAIALRRNNFPKQRREHKTQTRGGLVS